MMESLADQKPDKPYAQELGETFLKSPYTAAGVKDVYPARSAAEEMARNIVRSRTSEGLVAGQQEKIELKRQVELLLRENKPIPAELQQKFENLSRKEMQTMITTGAQTQLQTDFHNINNIKDAVEVIKVATPEERQQLIPFFAQKVQNVMKNVAPAEREAIFKKLQEVNQYFTKP